MLLNWIKLNTGLCCIAIAIGQWNGRLKKLYETQGKMWRISFIIRIYYTKTQYNNHNTRYRKSSYVFCKCIPWSKWYLWWWQQTNNPKKTKTKKPRPKRSNYFVIPYYVLHIMIMWHSVDAEWINSNDNDAIFAWWW